MAETLILPQIKEKSAVYEAILPQIKALIADEPNMVANLANISAALKEAFDFFWVGFYLAEDDALVLGPFQGPIACTRIKSGKGVCGTSFAEAKTVIVPDVDQFPGHIACSSASRSEIVVPVIAANMVKMVLDIDSDQLNTFDETDQHWLEQLAQLIAEKY